MLVFVIMIRSIFGYCIFLILAYLLSTNKYLFLKKHIRYVVCGICLQILLAFAMTNVPVIIHAMESIAHGVMKLKDATLEGTKFVFGYIGSGDLPFTIKEGGSTFILAFQALPTVILVSIIGAILAHLKITPYISKFFGSLFKRVFGVRDSIGMISFAKIFLGQFEAPLLVKSQLPSLSKSEVFIILSLAFSTASASIMPVYAMAISSICPNAMTHMIIASVIGVVSTLIVCTIMMPREDTGSLTNNIPTYEKPYPDFMTALSKGTADGAYVWWAIVGSLIGMIALLSLINYIFLLFPDVNGSPITLQRIFGIIMYPFAWIIGIADKDIFQVSEILGTKFVLNEIIAFFDMAKTSLSKESIVTTIYALTNFGNFACIGMTVGGLMAICPTQKEIPSIGFMAFVAGTLATGLTATLMSFFYS